MVRYDHKNDKRLEYLTRTYNFVHRWKKLQEQDQPRNMTEADFKIKITQVQERIKAAELTYQSTNTDEKRARQSPVPFPSNSSHS